MITRFQSNDTSVNVVDSSGVYLYLKRNNVFCSLWFSIDEIGDIVNVFNEVLNSKEENNE